MKSLFSLALALAALPGTAAGEFLITQGASGEVMASAAFHYRSVSHGGRSYFLDRHLVVQLTLSSTALRRLKLSAGQFHLRVNGKAVLAAEPAGLVAYSMKWQGTDQGVRAQAGPIILGGPPTQPRFPGDRTGQPLPRVPESRPAGAPARPEEQDLGEVLAEAALPEGDLLLPVSGYLYFRYPGKIKSIKKLELLYQAPEGPLTLRLR